MNRIHGIRECRARATKAERQPGALVDARLQQLHVIVWTGPVGGLRGEQLSRKGQ